MNARVEIAGVGKRYGAVAALSGVSLSIAAGERVAFVGTNGSGKTTLLRAMMGLVAVDGRVAIDGHDVHRRPDLALRDVAYIPQVAPPLDAPVGEVARATVALRGGSLAQVAEFAEKFGIDFARAAAVRLRDLSGGTKQKILAALAFAADAPILVCDEPTANLDLTARQTFFSLAAARPADAILVLCSHRTDEVRQLVGRVVELADGRVASDARLDRALAARDTATIEVAVAADAAGAIGWMEANGFAPIGGRRWQRACGDGDKVGLVTALLDRHSAEVADLTIRDRDAWHAREAT